MDVSTSREKILKKIRQALIHHSPQPFPNLDWDSSVYTTPAEGLNIEEIFANEFKALGGRFIFCEDEIAFLDQLVELTAANGWQHIVCAEPGIRKLLDDAQFPYQKTTDDFEEGLVSITSCESLVARLGAVVVSSKSESGRQLVVAPTTHLVLAYTSQVVPDVKSALACIREKYGEELPSFIATIAGPSRTADIEKTLVTPAHGPKDIFVFLVDDNK